MNEWMWPTFGAFLVWGFWGFLPKFTTRYIDPKSAIVYEVLGAMVLGAIALLQLNFQLDVNAKGIALAMMTGILGFMGAFFFLSAVSKGSVIFVVTLSALYPIVSIFLATIVLHETITLKQGVGILLALISVVLVVV